MAKSIQATTLLLIAVILATVSAPTRTAFADAAGDRAVLVALYNAGGGDNWTNRSNWLSDEPINDWYGITTDANGRVTRACGHSNPPRVIFPVPADHSFRVPALVTRLQ